MTYRREMCIVCFAPTKSNINCLYGLRVYGRQDAIMSELGLMYQDLFQISLQTSDKHPQYICEICKKKLTRFNEFKKKALMAYSQIMEEQVTNSGTRRQSEINPPGEDSTPNEANETSKHQIKIEEITVFDISTRQTEKFEIQYIDDDNDMVEEIDISHEEEEETPHEIIEIEDSKCHLESLINPTMNGTVDDQDEGRLKKLEGNGMSLQIKCQLCCKKFDTNEEFNIHWSEHTPNYSPETKKSKRRKTAWIVKCSVNGCTKTRSQDTKLKFFRFPRRNAELFKRWLNVCCLGSIPIWKNIYVCSRHFKAEDMGTRKLKKNVIPSLHIPADGSCRRM